MLRTFKPYLSRSIVLIALGSLVAVGSAEELHQGCTVELHLTRAGSANKPTCTKALVTFAGKIAAGANSERMTIRLRTKLHGKWVTIIRHTRVKHGQFHFSVTLSGSRAWAFTISYPGDRTLRPVTMSGHSASRSSQRLNPGRPDLNRGPHRPERCALPGCATPR